MAAAPGEGKARRAYSTLRHRDFRLLWGAELASTTGAQMQRVAIAWQVYDLTGDALKLGLLGLARFVPIVIFGLIGGVLADQRDRRHLLFVTQSALMLSSLTLAALTFTDSISIWAIYGMTVVSGALTAIGRPARQALIPALVPRDELAGAISMNTLSFQVATVAGPALGGLAISGIGLGWVYVFDALSFVVVLLAIFLMHTRPPAIGATTNTTTAIVEGFAFLRSSPILLGVMSVDFIATFFGAITTLMPIFADDILGSGPGTLGLLLAAPAVGSIIGGAIMSARPIAVRPGFGVLVAIVVYGFAILAFGLSTSFAVSLFFLALSGASDAVSMILRTTLRNLVTPDHLLGRISATHSMFAMGGPQLGEFRAGAMASFMGAGPAVAIGGAMTVASAVLVARLVPGIRRYTATSDITQSIGAR
jgi:MFS family permease